VQRPRPRHPAEQGVLRSGNLAQEMKQGERTSGDWWRTTYPDQEWPDR
jgi:hypothetical protein